LLELRAIVQNSGLVFDPDNWVQAASAVQKMVVELGQNPSAISTLARLKTASSTTGKVVTEELLRDIFGTGQDRKISVLTNATSGNALTAETTDPAGTSIVGLKNGTGVGLAGYFAHAATGVSSAVVVETLAASGSISTLRTNKKNATTTSKSNVIEAVYDSVNCGAFDSFGVIAENKATGNSGTQAIGLQASATSAGSQANVGLRGAASGAAFNYGVVSQVPSTGPSDFAFYGVGNSFTSGAYSSSDEMHKSEIETVKIDDMPVFEPKQYVRNQIGRKKVEDEVATKESLLRLAKACKKEKREPTEAELEAAVCFKDATFDMGGGFEFGYIAQEVQKAMPWAVAETPDGLAIRYSDIVAFQGALIQKLRDDITNIKTILKVA
jgi:hypothetical protein